MNKKYVSEFIGTMTLVLFGCGTAVIAGDNVGFLGISFAFGFALIAMAYGIGPVSGCHINPAVSLGAYVAGRLDQKDLKGYIISQFLGGFVGALILRLIVAGKLEGYDVAVNGLGQNGWGPGYLGEYGVWTAFLFELVATFLFVIVILGSTQNGAPTQLAGLAIGITLVVIHIVGIPITGVSVNPARSFGPALFAGGKALPQLLLFLIVPSVGGWLAGHVFHKKYVGIEE